MELIWPSNWMIIPILLGTGSYIAVRILKEQGALKHLQPTVIHIIAGIFVAILSMTVARTWSTVIAAGLWAILLPPIAYYAWAIIATLLSQAWNALGGKEN